MEPGEIAYQIYDRCSLVQLHILYSTNSGLRAQVDRYLRDWLIKNHSDDRKILYLANHLPIPGIIYFEGEKIADPPLSLSIFSQLTESIYKFYGPKVIRSLLDKRGAHFGFIDLVSKENQLSDEELIRLLAILQQESLIPAISECPDSRSEHDFRCYLIGSNRPGLIDHFYPAGLINGEIPFADRYRLFVFALSTSELPIFKRLEDELVRDNVSSIEWIYNHFASTLQAVALEGSVDVQDYLFGKIPLTKHVFKKLFSRGCGKALRRGWRILQKSSLTKQELIKIFYRWYRSESQPEIIDTDLFEKIGSIIDWLVEETILVPESIEKVLLPMMWRELIALNSEAMNWGAAEIEDAMVNCQCPIHRLALGLRERYGFSTTLKPDR